MKPFQKVRLLKLGKFSDAKTFLNSNLSHERSPKAKAEFLLAFANKTQESKNLNIKKLGIDALRNFCEKNKVLAAEEPLLWLTEHYFITEKYGKAIAGFRGLVEVFLKAKNPEGVRAYAVRGFNLAQKHGFAKEAKYFKPIAKKYFKYQPK